MDNTLLSSNIFSGSAVILSLTIWAKSSSSFRRSVTDSSRNRFPCILEMESIPCQMYVNNIYTCWVAGGHRELHHSRWLVPVSCWTTQSLPPSQQNPWTLSQEPFQDPQLSAEHSQKLETQQSIFKVEELFEIRWQTCLKFGAPSKLFSSPSICIPSKWSTLTLKVSGPFSVGGVGVVVGASSSVIASIHLNLGLLHWCTTVNNRSY